MKLKQLIAPTSLPVSLESLKNFLRVLDSEQDEQIVILAKSSIKRAENITNRQLAGVATFVLYLDGFAPIITLPKSPLIEVEKIEYLDKNKFVQTLEDENYEIDDKATPAIIKILSIPSSFIGGYNTVGVTFRSGYESIPSEVEAWIKINVNYDFYQMPISERSVFIDNALDSLRIVPI